MRFATILASPVGALAIACHGAAPRAAESAPPNAERTVFTDSALHAERCEPIQRGEDWRKVCVPKDQSVQVRPKP
jgi:hypothetical protein